MEKKQSFTQKWKGDWTYSKQGPGGCNDSKTGFTSVKNSFLYKLPRNGHRLDLVIVYSYVSTSYSFQKKMVLEFVSRDNGGPKKKQKGTGEAKQTEA